MEKEILEKATFAGGCFWCIESAFDETEGVKEAVSGYTGGKTKNPTYAEVCTGKTGHYEAVQVTFDSNKIIYKDLVEIFWQQIDPTDPEGQFADKGSQYKTAIFYHNEEQKRIAEESKKALEESGKFDKPIVTEIREATEFYPAEDYHQDYYKTCPLRYKAYKIGSGRESFLKKVWKKVTD
ncbi:peptide-methionine (S)-S-oxide reductase MsrA [candidate division WOR-3 bacterium]|nr:peptide-methionine (S)-S-oxide reductase MsrA [candidate division WOR-3 bacterium]